MCLLSERVTQLQQTVQELQKVLEIMHRSREEDQHALQQEVEKRDKLIQSLSSENRQRQRILQVNTHTHTHLEKTHTLAHIQIKL